MMPVCHNRATRPGHSITERLPVDPGLCDTVTVTLAISTHTVPGSIPTSTGKHPVQSQLNLRIVSAELLLPLGHR